MISLARYLILFGVLDLQVRAFLEIVLLFHAWDLSRVQLETIANPHHGFSISRSASPTDIEDQHSMVVEIVYY